jgi:hypothetical protein
MGIVLEAAEALMRGEEYDIERGYLAMHNAEYYLVQTGRLAPTHRFKKVHCVAPLRAVRPYLTTVAILQDPNWNPAGAAAP